ncbi:MAG: hypothetical protein ACR2O6_06755, partial [Ilumatobacteraceae bacterium]
VYGISQDMPDGLIPQLREPLRGMGNPLHVVRHPIRSIRGGWRFTRSLLRDIWASTTRPRRVEPTPGKPCRWAAQAPSVD